MYSLSMRTKISSKSALAVSSVSSFITTLSTLSVWITKLFF